MSYDSESGGPQPPAGQWEVRPERAEAADGRSRRTGYRRLLPTWRMVLFGALAAGVVLLGGLIAGYLLVEIPEPQSAAAAQSNHYLYADGTSIARVGEVNRENVGLSEIPEHVQHAVMAAEDRDFYSAPAVDITAMVRAGWNMLRGESRQSGSTITQQYVKNYYLDQQQTVARKAKELFISVKLAHQTSKEEILEGYLNTSYFGRNAYGIQAAAHAYYDKDAADLTAAEGAYLAALLNAPGAYDTHANPENEDRAISRWEYVVDGMASEGWLSGDQREELEFPDPGEPTVPEGLSGQRGYLVETIRQHLLDHGVIDEDRLASGGLRVTTTIEPDKQEALTSSVREQLLDNLNEERETDTYVRSGATSVEVGTGRVVAMYGGTDYIEQYVNDATRRDYQAASTFKPFVYAAALENESVNSKDSRIGPGTQYNGDSGREVTRRDGQGTGWSPENEGGQDYGDVTVSTAMDKSINAVFAQMGQDVGAELITETAVALGLPAQTPGLDDAVGAISLGTATPSTLDMASAYATLASHGEHHPLVLVREITHNGEQLELPEPSPERALSRKAADGTTAMLESVVKSGTGSAAASVGRPAAGKTGTAEEDKAAWFAGYTPELATVVAVFGQNPETGGQEQLYGAAGLERMSGGGIPARIWGQYTAAALKGEPEQEFDLDAKRADITPDPSASGVPGEGGETSEDEPDGGADASEGGTPSRTTSTTAPAEPHESTKPRDPEPSTAATVTPGAAGAPRPRASPAVPPTPVAPVAGPPAREPADPSVTVEAAGAEDEHTATPAPTPLE